MYDVVIIGAGVIGCAIARELARYEVHACVLEKEEDVCTGTSKANSGIVHAGYDAKPGTLKAKLNVQGNKMMDALSQELDFPFKRNGSLVICHDEEGVEGLEKLKRQGKANGVEGLEIINQERLSSMEPAINQDAYAALYAPSGGIVCPFNLTIALAENAYVNGIEFKLNTEAFTIDKTNDGYLIQTNQGNIETKAIVNAAGVYADKFHNMVSADKIHITPRKGEYCLFDHLAGDIVTHTLFQLPTKMGKGVLVTPTVHGNLLIGPTAEDIEDKEAICTTAKGMNLLLDKAEKTLEIVPRKQIITSFAGLRAHEDAGEFIIAEAKDSPGFFDAAGIESPGLSCAPAIGVMVSELVKDKLHLKKKENFIATRKGIKQVHALPLEERMGLIEERKEYAHIICRCEMISEGEILDAIRRPLGAKSLDGIKRRVRAGMGRCQSGFCMPKVMAILERETSLTMQEITKCGGASTILADDAQGEG